MYSSDDIYEDQYKGGSDDDSNDNDDDSNDDDDDDDDDDEEDLDQNHKNNNISHQFSQELKPLNLKHIDKQNKIVHSYEEFTQQSYLVLSLHEAVNKLKINRHLMAVSGTIKAVHTFKSNISKHTTTTTTTLTATATATSEKDPTVLDTLSSSGQEYYPLNGFKSPTTSPPPPSKSMKPYVGISLILNTDLETATQKIIESNFDSSKQWVSLTDGIYTIYIYIYIYVYIYI